MMLRYLIAASVSVCVFIGIVPKSVSDDYLIYNEETGEFELGPDAYKLSPDYKINQLAKRFDDAHEGTAVALSIPYAHIEPHHNFAFAMNIGTFEGENAIGAAGAIRMNDNLTFTGGVGAGLDEGTVGGRAGFNLSW